MDNTKVLDIDVLWEQFSNPLKSFIKNRVSNEQDAEDILQDVFFKIHRNIKDLKATEKINAWVYRIARNSIIDFYRTQKFKKEISELSEDIAIEIEDETTENEEIAKCLKTMIMHLPEGYKQALILTEFQNLTQKELSKSLGLSVSGAKSRVQRARTELKRVLLDCCELELDRRGNIIEYKKKCNDCKFC